MYRTLVCRCNQTFLKTTSVFIISLSLIFSPVILINDAFAAGDPNDFWIIDYLKANVDSTGANTSIEARAAKRTIIEGSAVDVRAITVVSTDAAEVGSIMSKRMKLAAGGVAGLLGAAAVGALLEGIGWVMTDGTYVKTVMPTDNTPNPTNIPKAWAAYVNGGYVYYATPQGACTARGASIGWTFISVDAPSDGWATCRFQEGSAGVFYTPNPNYNPNSPPPQPYTVPITDAQVGQVIYHRGYTDPDPNFNNSTVNTGNPNTDIIQNAATKQDAEGDNPIDNKLKSGLNNPANQTISKTGTTSTSTSSSNATTKDKDGNTTTTTNTSSTSVANLPAFCTYAASLCDWLNWTKEEPKDPEKEDPPEIKEPDVSAAPTNYITGNGQCPPDRVIPISLGGVQSQIVLSYQPLCTVASQFAPAVSLMSSIAALMIVTGTGRRAEVEG